MNYLNKHFKKAMDDAQDIPFSEQTRMINKYPEAKVAFCALILMIQEEHKRRIDVSDWECDFSENVWPVIQKRG